MTAAAALVTGGGGGGGACREEGGGSGASLAFGPVEVQGNGAWVFIVKKNHLLLEPNHQNQQQIKESTAPFLFHQQQIFHQ